MNKMMKVYILAHAVNRRTAIDRSQIVAAFRRRPRLLKRLSRSLRKLIKLCRSDFTLIVKSFVERDYKIILIAIHKIPALSGSR